MGIGDGDWHRQLRHRGQAAGMGHQPPYVAGEELEQIGRAHV